MGQKEENWNIVLRKAAHKNAMQHVQQPLANKDGVKEVVETFISGAVCAKYILANKLLLHRIIPKQRWNICLLLIILMTH